MVRVPGVEPGRITRRILSPLGLPIPPYSLVFKLYMFLLYFATYILSYTYSDTPVYKYAYAPKYHEELLSGFILWLVPRKI